jgi:hypothetical protein
VGEPVSQFSEILSPFYDTRPHIVIGLKAMAGARCTTIATCFCVSRAMAL